MGLVRRRFYHSVDSRFWITVAAASSPITLRSSKDSGLLGDPHAGVLGTNLKTITRDVLDHADEAMGGVWKSTQHFCVYPHRCGCPAPLHELVNSNIPRYGSRSSTLHVLLCARMAGQRRAFRRGPLRSETPGLPTAPRTRGPGHDIWGRFITMEAPSRALQLSRQVLDILCLPRKLGGPRKRDGGVNVGRWSLFSMRSSAAPASRPEHDISVLFLRMSAGKW